MINREMIKEFFLPHYRENWEYAHSLGMDVWLYCCGHILEILPDFIDAGLNIIQQDQQENMGLENLAAVAGGKLAFWNPVDIQKTMIEGTVEEFRQYAKKMIETLDCYGGGFISKAYATPEDVKHTPEKLRAMCESFRKNERLYAEK